ncbi:MAG: hypothetical protein ACC645_08530 [Pirellulales bacterium]
MSDDNQDQMATPQDAITEPFMKFWSSYLEQANDNAQKVFETINGTADPVALRRQWLEAVSQSADAYLRSPSFLEAMRHNMEAVVQTKADSNDLAKEVARNVGIPTTSDISGLFERLHCIEETILSRLGTIESRLEKIEHDVAGREKTAR